MTVINVCGGPIQRGQKILKCYIFSKVLKLFIHGTICFGIGLELLFLLYECGSFKMASYQVK